MTQAKETPHEAGRRIVHEANVALARRGNSWAIDDLRRTHPFLASLIVANREAEIAFRARVIFSLRVNAPRPLIDVTSIT